MPEARSSRRILNVAVRLLLGVAFLAFVIWKSGGTGLQDAFRSARFAFIVLAFGFVIVGVIVSAVRWSIFLTALGYPRPVAYLVRLYTAGFFFNTFLPTGVGGDVFKALRVRWKDAPADATLASVLLDRLVGVAALGALGIVAAGVRIARGDRSRVVLIGGLLSIAILIGMAILVYAQRLIDAVLGRYNRFKLVGYVHRVMEAINTGVGDRQAATRAMGTAVVYQASVIAFHAALLSSLRLHVPLTVLVCIVVIVTLAAFLPITLNGLGVREGAYLWALHAYGVPKASGLAFGLLVLGLLLAAGVMGGIVYLLGGANPPEGTVTAGA